MALATLATSGCVTSDDGVGAARAPLSAICTAEVEGSGSVDVETEYLARVVNCENGGAAFEALKAQAVAARSYLYYKMLRSGSIADGTGDQVFSCGREPREEHYRAVAETSGIVLQYAGTQVAAFYVAGSRQTPPECRGGDDDPTGTEHFVTYNRGLAGDDLVQTTLGWVNPGNHANRGCLAQNGSHCLATAGWPFEDILHFYYGEDIELVYAEGPCVVPAATVDASTPEPDGGVGDGGFEDGGLEDGGLEDSEPPDVTPTFDASLFDGGRSDGDDGAFGARSDVELSGGCAAARAPSGSAWLAALVLGLWARRRRVSRAGPRSARTWRGRGPRGAGRR